MIRCPRCDVEVEPTWETCAGCGLAAHDVTLDDLTLASGAGGDEVRAPHAPPPYDGRRPTPAHHRPGTAALAATVAGVAIVIGVLAVLFLTRA